MFFNALSAGAPPGTPLESFLTGFCYMNADFEGSEKRVWLFVFFMTTPIRPSTAPTDYSTGTVHSFSHRTRRLLPCNDSTLTYK